MSLLRDRAPRPRSTPPVRHTGETHDHSQYGQENDAEHDHVEIHLTAPSLQADVAYWR